MGYVFINKERVNSVVKAADTLSLAITLIRVMHEFSVPAT